MPVIRYFQTAAFSIGFDLDAIEHERSSRIKRFNTKSQRMQKVYVAPVSYYNNNWDKQTSMIGGKQKYLRTKAMSLKTAQLRVKMVEDLGVKRYSVREESGVWRQNTVVRGREWGNGHCCATYMKHMEYIVKKHCETIQDCQCK